MVFQGKNAFATDHQIFQTGECSQTPFALACFAQYINFYFNVCLCILNSPNSVK